MIFKKKFKAAEFDADGIIMLKSMEIQKISFV